MLSKEDLLELVKLEGDSKIWDYTTKNGLVFKLEIIRSSLGHLCGYIYLETEYYSDFDVDKIISELYE